jgi:acetyl/propionyl-CoA carboxylase alpha subunit
MFKKILVANRGEIAVRIVRACRDMGISTVALYEAPDSGSLHVRLSDECVQLTSSLGYMDVQAIVEIAKRTGAEAIHPGYGFLAEDPGFIRACDQSGIVFIGPSAEVVEVLRNKIAMLEQAEAAGFAVPSHSSVSFRAGEFDIAFAEANNLGFPLIIKPCSGGRGRATRVVRGPETFEKELRIAAAEAHIVFGNDSLFLERLILPVNFVDVQIVADNHGNIVHFGEREGSIQRNSQKLISESPAPCLKPEQRAELHQTAIEIARLFGYRNVGTVEFLVDKKGKFYFTEIKARIQVEHPLNEMRSHVDIVRQQIEIASGKRLELRQQDVHLHGWAMQCRINAEDPWNHYMPSPGLIRRFRMPGGPYVRVDTYGYGGVQVPVRYDPILAKLAVWGETREECLRRMRRTLEDFAIAGVRTNLPVFQRILEDPDFIGANYNTDFMRRPLLKPNDDPSDDLMAALAAAAAIAYLAHYQGSQPVMPRRLLEGWRQSGRQLPG